MHPFDHTPLGLLVIFLSEAFATTIHLTLGCLSYTGATDVTVLVPSFGFGFSVLAAIQVFGPISGANINPTVSVCMIIIGKLKWTYLFIYCVAQYCGGFFGFTLAWYLAPESIRGPKFCVVEKSALMSVASAYCMEIMANWIYCWVWCSLVDSRHKDKKDSEAMRTALSITGIYIATAPFTSGGLDPARSLPPNIFAKVYKDLYIWQTAPFIGSVIAGVVWRFLFCLEEPRSLASYIERRKAKIEV